MTSRAMTVRFGTGLLVVAMTACGGFGAMVWSEGHVTRHREAVRSLGDQSESATRILLRARAYLDAPSPAEKAQALGKLLETLDRLDKAHGALAKSPGGPSKRWDGELESAYTDPDDGLSAHIRRYIDDVRELIRLESEQDIDEDHPHAQYVLYEAPQELITKIRAVADAHREESQRRAALATRFGGFMVLAILLVLILEGLFLFRPMVREITYERLALERANASLERLATRDHLTNTYNRTKLDEIAELELARASRTGSPLGCILLDVDHFKSFNDTHGHSVGDEVLKHVADTLQSNTRAMDYVVRYGGEEFLVVTPGNDLDATAHAAEKLRAAIEQAELDGGLSVTASFGVTTTDGTESIDAVVERADRALYAAKDGGRNKVTSRAQGAAA